MKLPIMILCAWAFVMPSFADDVKLAERKSCEQIKAEIAELSAIKNPSADETAEFNKLTMQQRANCTIKSSGRRAIARNMPTTTVAETPAAATKSDALTEYLNNKKSNCDKLNAEIEKLTGDNTSATNAIILAELQRYYGADCAEHPAPVAEETPAVPEKTDAELDAEFNANIAAGLCGDGTKPNRFGCCADEVFRDLGNARFACCPKSGGDLCFPPLTSAK